MVSAMNSPKKTIIVPAPAAWPGMPISGCNTVHGAGKDLKKAGDSIENSADRHR
jgi:predicted small secreted protein